MRFATGFTLTLPAIAAATIIPRGGGLCNTGPLQCCNQVQEVDPVVVHNLMGLLGIVTETVGTLVGINCSPMSVFGTGGNSCTAQPACCTDNQFNGFINFGCAPINGDNLNIPLLDGLSKLVPLGSTLNLLE